jgi:hypothetical protein
MFWNHAMFWQHAETYLAISKKSFEQIAGIFFCCQAMKIHHQKKCWSRGSSKYSKILKIFYFSL